MKANIISGSVQESGHGSIDLQGMSMNLNELLERHDIRYLSPAAEGRFGLPVGNGDLAAMVWTPPDRLQLTINKSSTWDDAPELPVPDWHWSPQTEETMTGLVSCAAVSISNHLPLYETMYLDDFEARVHLWEGNVSVSAQSPLCQTQVQVYATRDPDVLVVDYAEVAQEAVEREIVLSRWGSRRFFHWFAQLNPDTGVGLDGTTVGCDGKHLWIEQKLRRISFAVVARFVGASVHMDCPNSHTARIRTEATRELRGQLVVTVVTSEEHADPLAEARRRVDAAVALGHRALVQADAERWADFWSRSFVRIADPYVENLYYFSRYLLNASSTGPYPTMHHGTVWLWNHDIGNWGSYYHWNMQQMVWPVHAAGHPEMAQGYYEWRYNSLAHAQEMARRVHRIGGAFYTDVSDRDGRQALDNHLSHNLTCATQIAMDFWRHFLYTGDEDFLRRRAYPMMKAAAQFYLEYLEQDEEGIYHVPCSTCYEDIVLQRDSVTDLVTIRQSFAACIDVARVLDVDAALRLRWQDVLDHLAGFTLTQEDGQTVFASGIAIDDGKLAKPSRSYQQGDALFNCWFWGPMAPAFPSGFVGMAQAGTELFEAARNTARIVGPTSAGGWIPSSIWAARLGLTDEALDWLAWYIGHCQTLPQGFMQEGQYRNGSTNIWEADEPALIRDGKRSEEKTRLLSWRHDVPAPECNCNLMTIVQEMLFQSHDGTLRVFPATPGAWGNAAFRLHAVGGFIVTAQRFDGETAYIQIESLRGRVCRVANPWPGVRVSVQCKEQPHFLLLETADLLAFETETGKTYLMRPASRLEEPLAEGKWDAPDPGPRRAYGRLLGLPRYF